MKAAAICYRRRPALEYLLVRTKGGKYWIFPKGGVDAGEEPWEAAAREAGEEAGAEGQVDAQEVAEFENRGDGASARLIPAYLLEVSNPDRLHPEETWRKSQWFAPDEAVNALREGRAHNESASLIEALKVATRLLG